MGQNRQLCVTETQQVETQNFSLFPFHVISVVIFHVNYRIPPFFSCLFPCLVGRSGTRDIEFSSDRAPTVNPKTAMKPPAPPTIRFQLPNVPLDQRVAQYKMMWRLPSWRLAKHISHLEKCENRQATKWVLKQLKKVHAQKTGKYFCSDSENGSPWALLLQSNWIWNS